MFTYLPVVYFVSGALLFIWGWVQLGLDWGSVIASPKVANPTDALGLFDSPQPEFNIVKLLGWATVVEGLLLFVVGLGMNSGEEYFWHQFTLQEIRERRNYVRWIRWALTDAVFFAALAFLLEINQVWVIISLTVVAIGLNFAQAANETENAIIAGYEKIDNKTDFMRIDAWVVATAIFAYMAVLFSWKLAVTGGSTGVYVAIIAWLAIYFLLHVFILAFTNIWKMDDAYFRDFVFELFRFVAIVVVTISAFY